jgi:hypothetical protein
MRLFLAALILAVHPATLAAQTCALADSILGPAGKPFKPKLQYDKMTDTTATLVTYISKVPMFGDPGMMTMLGYFPGKNLIDSALVRMTLEFSQQGEGGVIVGRSAAGPGKLSTEMARYAEVKDAKFLFDDSVRFSLPLETYSIGLKKAGALLPEKLTETLTFLVPQSTRIAISHMHAGKMRIGTYEFDFGPNPVEGVRRFTRWELCNNSAVPTS